MLAAFNIQKPSWLRAIHRTIVQYLCILLAMALFVVFLLTRDANKLRESSLDATSTLANTLTSAPSPFPITPLGNATVAPSPSPTANNTGTPSPLNMNATPAPTFHATPSPTYPGMVCEPSYLIERCCTPARRCPLGYGGCAVDGDCLEGHCAESHYKVEGRFLKVCLSGKPVHHNATSGGSQNSTILANVTDLAPGAEEEAFDKSYYTFAVVFTVLFVLLGLVLLWLSQDTAKNIQDTAKKSEHYKKGEGCCLRLKEFVCRTVKEETENLEAGIEQFGANMEQQTGQLITRTNSLYHELYMKCVKEATKVGKSGLNNAQMDLRQDLMNGKICYTGHKKIDWRYYMQYNHSGLVLFKVNPLDARSRSDVWATLTLATFGAVVITHKISEKIGTKDDFGSVAWLVDALLIQLLMKLLEYLATCQRYQRDNVAEEQRKRMNSIGSTVLAASAALMFAYALFKMITDTSARAAYTEPITSLFTTWVMEYAWLSMNFYGWNPRATSWEKDKQDQREEFEKAQKGELEEEKNYQLNYFDCGKIEKTQEFIDADFTDMELLFKSQAKLKFFVVHPEEVPEGKEEVITEETQLTAKQESEDDADEKSGTVTSSFGHTDL